MSGKVLVAVDFSPITPLVVSWATSLARDRGSSLVLLHVQEPVADPAAGELSFPLPFEESPELRQALDSLAPHDPMVRVERRLLQGMAPECILETASQEHVELIVLGSHGRGWIGRLLMGSVVQSVLRCASCPVLVVSLPCTPPTACDHAEVLHRANG